MGEGLILPEPYFPQPLLQSGEIRVDDGRHVQGDELREGEAAYDRDAERPARERALGGLERELRAGQRRLRLQHVRDRGEANVMTLRRPATPEGRRDCRSWTMSRRETEWLRSGDESS